MLQWKMSSPNLEAVVALGEGQRHWPVFTDSFVVDFYGSVGILSIAPAHYHPRKEEEEIVRPNLVLITRI